MTESSAAYDRGVAAGEITARLAGHDRHFEMINGQLADLTGEMKIMNLQQQRIADGLTADRERVIAAAAALEKADRDRMAASESRWTPWARILAVAAFLVPAAALAAYIFISNRR